MPDHVVTIIAAIIAALSGAGGIVAWYKAGTERRKILADAEVARQQVLIDAEEARGKVKAEVEKTASDCWKELNISLQQRLTVVTSRLNELETQLEHERSRANTLEAKVRHLEEERERWRAERDALMDRIAELEECR